MLVLVLVLVLGLIGCAPRVVYQFTPPEDSAGRSCVLDCGTQRSRCLDEVADAHAEVERRYRQCLDDSALMQGNYDACVAAAGVGCIPPRACHAEATGRSSSRYEELHRMCYRDCGGQVVAHESQ